MTKIQMKIPAKLSIILISLISLIFSISLSLILPQKSFAHSGYRYIIEINDSGFSPDSLTILQGDTVEFKNSGQFPHWPASDIHPTHQIYPQFDPKKEIAPTKTWSFRFTRVGNWKMHDHMFPENIGTITVNRDPDFIDNTSSQPSFLERAKAKIEDLKIAVVKKYYQLFPRELDKILAGVNIHTVAANTDANGIRYYLKILGSKVVMDKLVADSGGGSVVDCHQEAHRIGRIAYEIYGAEVFQMGNSSCHSGFYHGAMEEFLKEKGTVQIAKNITELCNKFPTSFGNFECLHGVGHGVMAFENYELPKALQTCKQLSTGFEQSSCYGGVFMENIVTAEGNGASTAHETKWVNSDPQFPCNAVSKEMDIQMQCYLIQTSRMLDISGYSFDFVTENCLKAPEDLRTICFQSEGRDAAGQTLRDPGKIIAICDKVPATYHANCINGALNVIVEFWAEKMDDKPHALCKLVINPTSKRECYSLLASRLTGIYGEKSSQISKSCTYFEPFYQTLCHSYTKV